MVSFLAGRKSGSGGVGTLAFALEFGEDVVNKVVTFLTEEALDVRGQCYE